MIMKFYSVMQCSQLHYMTKGYLVVSLSSILIKRNACHVRSYSKKLIRKRKKLKVTKKIIDRAYFRTRSALKSK